MIANRKNKKYKTSATTRVIVFGFLTIILIGTCFLLLPAASKSGNGVNFLDALFTATSATCVTGLSVFNIFDTYTIFGQVVILTLIQIGGLGFMALTSFVYMLLSRRVSLSSKLAINEDISGGNIKTMRRTLRRIVALTFGTELVGAVFLIGGFSVYMPAGEAVWNGIFHSVSAFCNAGMDIIAAEGAGSLTRFSSDPLILLPIAALVMIGGLGFMVVVDIWDSKTWRHFRLHTKVVLLMTAAMVLFGTLFFFGAEFNNEKTLGAMSTGDKFLNAFFHAIVTRTAGFSSFDLTAMNPASVFMSDVMMFIGAAPGSTAGGIKVTTLFVLVVTMTSVIRQRKYAIVDKQTIGSKTVHKAAAVVVLALTIMVLSMCALLLTDGNNFTFAELFFEQVSAYGTVGLSLGVTSGLSVGGKIIIILNMFLGRVGALTFFISFTGGKSSAEGKITYPECAIVM